MEKDCVLQYILLTKKIQQLKHRNVQKDKGSTLLTTFREMEKSPAKNRTKKHVRKAFCSNLCGNTENVELKKIDINHSRNTNSLNKQCTLINIGQTTIELKNNLTAEALSLSYK